MAIIGFNVFDVIANLFVSYFPQYSWYLRGSWAVRDEDFSVLWLGIYSILALLAMYCLPSRVKITATESIVTGEKYRLQSVVMFCFAIYATTSLLISKVWFVSRMNVYFVFSYCMIISIVINRLPFLTKRSVRILRGFFIIGLCIWGILMFQQNGHRILPYEFFWQ